MAKKVCGLERLLKASAMLRCQRAHTEDLIDDPVQRPSKNLQEASIDQHLNAAEASQGSGAGITGRRIRG